MTPRKIFTDSTNEERKTEVISACTECFLEKGLGETSVRDLSESIHLRSAGIYSYFESKDDAVRVCAEKAAMDIEKNMILYAVQKIKADPELLMEALFHLADENAPALRFYTQVCTTPRYADSLNGFREKLGGRFRYYISRCAEKLGVFESEFDPVFRMAVNAFSQYMLFGVRRDVDPQVKMVCEYLQNREMQPAGVKQE